jgi:hypothetical protein
LRGEAVLQRNTILKVLDVFHHTRFRNREGHIGNSGWWLPLRFLLAAGGNWWGHVLALGDTPSPMCWRLKRADEIGLTDGTSRAHNENAVKDETPRAEGETKKAETTGEAPRLKQSSTLKPKPRERDRARSCPDNRYSNTIYCLF